MIVDNAGTQNQVDDDIRALVKQLAPIAARLQCSTELQDVCGILNGGASYQRQRRLYGETGSFERVVEDLVSSLRMDVLG